jgi:hypothetical protein
VRSRPLEGSLKAEKLRAQTPEQTLVQWQAKAALAKVAALPDATRTQAFDSQNPQGKGTINDLEKQLDSPPASDLTRSYLEPLRSRQSGGR